MVPFRKMKKSKVQLFSYLESGHLRRLTTAREPRSARAILLHCSRSCPNLAPIPRNLIRSLRSCSPPGTRTLSYEAAHHAKASYSPFFPKPVLTSTLLQPNGFQVTSARSYAKPCGCGCACPFPCGPCGNCCGCGCLPPPCNTPPRCIQYMTGYYYYPYGVWFCGPYHVAGTCKAVGPCSPGGPCGPCCSPGGPCGPCCGPCGACGPCCVCPTPGGVLSAVGADQIKPGEVPSNQIKSTIPCSTPQGQTRFGISKYFPFNTTVTPQMNYNPGTRSRMHTSTSPCASCLVSPFTTQLYSTQAAVIPDQAHIDKPEHSGTGPGFTQKKTTLSSSRKVPSQQLSVSFNLGRKRRSHVIRHHKPIDKHYCFKACPQALQPTVCVSERAQASSTSSDPNTNITRLNHSVKSDKYKFKPFES